MKKKITFIYQDPTPYNIDLFNEINKSEAVLINVIYTVKHDSGDGAHIYNNLPAINFDHTVLSGNTLSKCIYIYKFLRNSPETLVVLMGYSEKAIAFAMTIMSFQRRKFISESDGFNLSAPVGGHGLIKETIRSFLREIMVKNSFFLLCAGGIKGRREALSIGFSEDAVIDFPYAISAQRISSQKSRYTRTEIEADLQHKFIIFVSARFIRRKGHLEFLNSIAKIKDYDFFIWLEGVGPLMDEIRDLTVSLGIEKKVRFLGFCEMEVHNWLLANSCIVAVPSLSDPWGIVVDEGMKLGKLVISTKYTGSALDRIEHGRNGFIYDPLVEGELISILKPVFSGEIELDSISENALLTGKKFDVSFNRKNFENAVLGRCGF